MENNIEKVYQMLGKDPNVAKRTIISIFYYTFGREFYTYDRSMEFIDAIAHYTLNKSVVMS